MDSITKETLKTNSKHCFAVYEGNQYTGNNFSDEMTATILSSDIPPQLMGSYQENGVENEYWLIVQDRTPIIIQLWEEQKTPNSNSTEWLARGWNVFKTMPVPPHYIKWCIAGNEV